MGTPGGASGGPGAIMVLSDDDHDGTAEETLFAGNLDDVHGIAVGGGYVYFTTKDNVWRTPYVDGQRTENLAARESLGLPGATVSAAAGHMASRGRRPASSSRRAGVRQCGNSHGGDISTIESGGALTTLATGLRNPMYLRCHAKDEVCAAMELGDDQREGAREKMIMLRMGTNYGFPCCHSTGVLNTEMMGVTCDDITMEDSAFKLSETPFGFDWEPGVWPEPYKNAVFVALHGSAYATPTWAGTRIVYAATDPQTHKPVQEWQDFLTGFGIGGSVLDRATDIVFSPMAACSSRTTRAAASTGWRRRISWRPDVRASRKRLLGIVFCGALLGAGCLESKPAPVNQHVPEAGTRAAARRGHRGRRDPDAPTFGDGARRPGRAPGCSCRALRASTARGRSPSRARRASSRSVPTRQAEP
jgi:hypothetical protein